MSLVEKALQKLHADRTVKRDSADTQLQNTGAPSRTVNTYQPPARETPSVPRPVEMRPAKTVRIDRDQLRSAGLLPSATQEHELATQYRAIKRPLIRNMLESPQAGLSPQQLVMLTSALPGDGKTFTSINLSLSMALERDHSVLLVDADVAKPHVSRIFNVENELGLLDVLADPTRPIESVILPTDEPGLSIVPAGRRSDTATELLASGRMREVAEHLASLYPRGIVLFDSSPMLLTTEARVLASLVGQVVVVVKAGSTPQHALKDTIELLGTGKRISLVLNQAEVTGPTSYYYGYHYGHKNSAADHSDAPR